MTEKRESNHGTGVGDGTAHIPATDNTLHGN
jgi:hypothetical protein